MAQAHTELVSCTFSTIPIMSLFNSSFTCLHSFFTCKLHVYYSFSANKELTFLTYGENTIRRGIQYTNEMCAPFCTSPNCSTDSSPQNVLTCNIALGQEASYTVLIDLGLTELRNVRDSDAPRSYVDSRSRAFSDSRAWLRKAI